MNQNYVKKFNAEEVGGRLLAVVNGKKAYIADNINGEWVLNELGEMLDRGFVEQEVEQPEVLFPVEVMARKRGRPRKSAVEG